MRASVPYILTSAAGVIMLFGASYFCGVGGGAGRNAPSPHPSPSPHAHATAIAPDLSRRLSTLGCGGRASHRSVHGREGVWVG